GARASETCGLDVEDFDLRLDDEHVRIHVASGTVRTMLVDEKPTPQARAAIPQTRRNRQLTRASARPRSTM
ncbi:MAG TPA: hypothetical protein VNW94_16710, partial [Streptosporangiaceae bacterium]|nr:hypothetical protein [Streptosporangiaceae bacterium]